MRSPYRPASGGLRWPIGDPVDLRSVAMLAVLADLRSVARLRSRASHHRESTGWRALIRHLLCREPYLSNGSESGSGAMRFRGGPKWCISNNPVRHIGPSPRADPVVEIIPRRYLQAVRPFLTLTSFCQ